MESLYLLFLAVIFIIFVFPLTFDAKISYDVLENRGSLSIRLWPLKFKVARIKRNGFNILSNCYTFQINTSVECVVADTNKTI